MRGAGARKASHSARLSASLAASAKRTNGRQNDADSGFQARRAGRRQRSMPDASARPVPARPDDRAATRWRASREASLSPPHPRAICRSQTIRNKRARLIPRELFPVSADPAPPRAAGGAGVRAASFSFSGRVSDQLAQMSHDQKLANALRPVPCRGNWRSSVVTSVVAR